MENVVLNQLSISFRSRIPWLHKNIPRLEAYAYADLMHASGLTTMHTD